MKPKVIGSCSTVGINNTHPHLVYETYLDGMYVHRTNLFGNPNEAQPNPAENRLPNVWDPARQMYITQSGELTKEPFSKNRSTNP